MKKLNKNQEYAVLWLSQQNRNSAQIAEELEISLDRVEAAIRQNTDPVKATKSKSKSKDLMITKTSNKKTKNVAIMTGEASALNDDLKKKFKGNTKDNQDYIFRPNND
jgi:regulator of extracellular matrix RemA (YlzA/DUF370 family)|tara:strand:+ start:866 stop:1189 length:324 start_codon:yes stop_codon:yes gene_type:complete